MGYAFRGEQHPGHKLTDRAVRQIRRASRAGATQLELARDHGVCRRTVQLIVQRLAWRHVDDTTEETER